MARRQQAFQKRIHTTRWAASSIVSAALSAGTSGATALSAGVPAETILRTRGTGLVYLDGASAPGRFVQVSMGLVLVPEGQGTTVIWDPFGDSNAPWLWYQESILGYEEMVTDVVDVPGASAHRFEVDSKAMRKANDDEELQFVVTNTTIGAAAPINVAVAFRFLLGH